MKKLVSILLLFVMTISALGAIPMTTAMAATSGTCGDNLTWTLDSEGTLTISGTGDMDDYEDAFDKPWFACTIKKIIIEHGVTSIGFGAFTNVNVESVEIANSVVNIGAEAFYQCYELTSINIPDSVESIGYNCFFNSNIENIIIGSGVKYIGEWAFENAYNLKNITVNPNNKYFSNDEFGALFNKDKTTLFKYPIGKTDTFYEIPQTVQEIANPAFRDAHYLTNIIIPDSVKTVSDYAFARCSMLENVQLPENVTSIGETAFYGCTSLKSITIPSSVTSIGDSAFSNCTSLTDVYYDDNKEQWSAINIGGSNTALTTATIHFTEPTPEIIANGTCGDNLTWTLDSEGTLTISGTGEISSYFISEYSNEVTRVIVESGVTAIGDSAFCYCRNLTEITIPDSVTKIGLEAFRGCINLSNLTIPDSVTTILHYAFENCTSLSGVTIPNGVTRIGIGAFAGCTSLSSITIPDSVTSMSSAPFNSCTSLNYITVSPGNTTCVSIDGVLFNKDQTTLIQYPAGKTRAEYIIPDGVKNIGMYAFAGCNSLNSITIPDSVTNIGTGTFSLCPNLTDIYYRGTEEAWGKIEIDMLFNQALATATIHFTEPTPEIIANGTCGNSVTWELDKNGVFTISGEGAMTNYSPFGGIPWHSLKKDIVEVVIEPGVTSLGSTAFNQFVNLSSITIPDSVTSVGSYTFAYCPNLNTVVLPDSITSIADYAFYSCSGLNSITIPNKVTSIGVSTFYNCTSLSSVVIPDSVTSIDGSAFSGCSALSDVYYGGTEEDWNDIIENNNSCLVNATIHFNFDVPTTKTFSKVTKSGAACTVQTSVYNIDDECSIIVAAYKNKEFVTAQSRPYTQDKETFTITEDIDEIKVMVWNSALKPICSAEVIESSLWIYE